MIENTADPEIGRQIDGAPIGRQRKVGIGGVGIAVDHHQAGTADAGGRD